MLFALAGYRDTIKVDIILEKGVPDMLLSLSLIFDLLIKWPLMFLFGPIGLLF